MEEETLKVELEAEVTLPALLPKTAELFETLSLAFESFVNKLSNLEAKLATVLGASLTDLLTSMLLCPLMGRRAGL